MDYMVQAVVNIISNVVKKPEARIHIIVQLLKKCVIYFQKSRVLGLIVFENVYKIMIKNIVNRLAMERVMMIRYVHLMHIPFVLLNA